MAWSLIIEILWEIFGDAISEFVRMILEKWFNKVVPHLPPPESFGSDDEGKRKAASAMIDAVIEELPWYAKFRKKLLREMKIHLMTSGGARPTALELEHIRSIAEQAEFE